MNLKPKTELYISKRMPRPGECDEVPSQDDVDAYME